MGDPYENALAERMNRTLKEEFGLGAVLKSKLHAKLLTEKPLICTIITGRTYL